MKIASYHNRIQVMLTTDEYVLLGRPEAIDVETQGNGILTVRRGTAYRPYKLDARHQPNGIAFSTSLPRPPSFPIFGLQNLLAVRRGERELMSPKPNLSKQPVVRSRQRTAATAADDLAVAGKPRVVPLEDAVYSINAHKRARPTDIVLTVDDKGFLDILLRLGR